MGEMEHMENVFFRWLKYN